MGVLLFGVLIGAAVVATIAAAGSRPVTTLILGVTLICLVAGTVATLPGSQTLCLAVSPHGSFPVSAPTLMWIMGLCASVGGFALGRTGELFRPAGRDTPNTGKPSSSDQRLTLEFSIIALCVIAALGGAGIGQISVPRALLLGLFTGAAVIAALDLRRALDDGAPEIRSNWGGLGGGLGGWEVSRPVVLVLAVLILSGAALATAVIAPPPPPFAPVAWAPSGVC